MAQARSILFTDAGGAQGIHLVRTSTGASGIQSALLSASNADWLQWWEGSLNISVAPAPVAAQYLPLRPAALLYYLCTDGTLAILRIPSPKASIFLADQETVDPSNVLVSAITAQAVGVLTNTAGVLAASFSGGRLESLRQR